MWTLPAVTSLTFSIYEQFKTSCTNILRIIFWKRKKKRSVTEKFAFEISSGNRILIKFTRKWYKGKKRSLAKKKYLAYKIFIKIYFSLKVKFIFSTILFILEILVLIVGSQHCTVQQKQWILKKNCLLN